MEIERKWLVDVQKASFALTNSIKVIRVDQYYLNNDKDEWQIRLRCYGEKFILDLKSKGLLSREELTFEITREAFNEAVKHAKKSIGKNRYIFPYGRYMCEIDGYDDYDFITCEVEFNTEEEANRFIAPDWCIKDVTMDSKYKNINLAK
jgi:CYTH domain-containing protein